MKKIILISSMLFISIACKSQQIDTSKRVILSQREIWTIHAEIRQAIARIHKWKKIEATERDTADMNLGYIFQIIEQKYNQAVADSIKKATNKPKP